MSEHRSTVGDGLYRRYLTWWVRFYPAPGAAQVRVNLHTHDELEAIEKARLVRAQAGQEVPELLQSCVAEVGLYAAHIKREGLATETIRNRKYILNRFVQDIGAGTPREITPAAMQVWFNARWKVKPHTAVAYLNVVSWWLAWVVKRRKLAANPAPAVVMPKALPMQRRRRFLKPAEARKVLDECADPDLKFALYCALHHGFRKLEVIEAPPEWFDITNGLIHITETDTFAPKDREKRTVPMTDEFRDWLREHYGLRGPFMLQPNVPHGKWRYRFDFRKPFYAHMAACKLADVTFHDLRRTFASLLVSQGVSVYKVAKWLGDTIEQTENTYGHLLPQDAEINPTYARRSKNTKPAQQRPHHRPAAIVRARRIAEGTRRKTKRARG